MTAVEPTSPPAPTEQHLPWATLLILAIGSFIAVLTETLPVGLLPTMAVDLGVSQSSIGLLVSFYAIAVVVASVPLNAWTARLPRRPLLMVLVSVYGVSNVILSLSHDYSLAVVARVLGGLTHALFFAVLFGYATAISPPQRVGTALTITSAGTGIAIAVGTPLGTMLGNSIGWRATFAGVAAVAAIIVVVLRFQLPPLPGSSTGGGAQLREVLARTPFRWVELATVIIMTGTFAMYTFMAPIMISFGYTTVSVAGALLIYGAASLFGLFSFGRLSNRHARLALATALSGLILTFTTIGLVPHTLVIGTALLIIWGVLCGPLSTFVQVAVIRSAAAHAETASAIHNAVFNIGIAAGAFVGSRILFIAPPTSIGFASAACLLIALPIVWHWLHPRRLLGS